MLTCSGCRLVTDWEDIEASHFNVVMVATKTHWLARIAHDMNNFRYVATLNACNMCHDGVLHRSDTQYANAS